MKIRSAVLLTLLLALMMNFACAEAPAALNAARTAEEVEAFLLYPPEDDLAGVQAGFICLIAQHRANDPIFRDAPCAVFALADSKYDLSACNCDSAVSYLELALPTLGLGACWAGFAMRAAQMSPAVKASFGLREGLIP